MHAGGEGVAAGERTEVGRGQLVLGAGPGHRALVGRVLQPTVGVGDTVTVQDIDDVESCSGGVAVGLPHAGRG